MFRRKPLILRDGNINKKPKLSLCLKKSPHTVSFLFHPKSKIMWSFLITSQRSHCLE